jgi:glutamate racemase
MNDHPIGIFDSGVGGLSVLRSILHDLPNEDVIYFADQAHVPYGSRTLEEVLAFSTTITEFLLDQGAKLIVIACNTASAAALRKLRTRFPAVPFVGMEPAVKPAASTTNSGVVGVLATPATFQGELYASVVERFAEGVTIMKDTLPGLVELIEAGAVDGTEVRQILASAVNPMIAGGADTLVLACTHFPFIIPALKDVAGPDVIVIDPSPAIARQTERLLRENLIRAGRSGQGTPEFFTSGDPEALRRLIRRLIDLDSAIQSIRWDRGKIHRDAA